MGGHPENLFKHFEVRVLGKYPLENKLLVGCCGTCLRFCKQVLRDRSNRAQYQFLVESLQLSFFDICLALLLSWLANLPCASYILRQRSVMLQLWPGLFNLILLSSWDRPYPILSFLWFVVCLFCKEIFKNRRLDSVVRCPKHLSLICQRPVWVQSNCLPWR